MEEDVAEVHAALLADALARSVRWRDALRRLGLAETEHRISQVTERAAALGFPTAHLRRRRRWDTFSADELRSAVESSRSMLEVFRQLDLSPGGASYRQMARLLDDHGIPRGHLVGGAEASATVTPRAVSVTDDELRAAFAGARSIAQILRRVGLVPRGGNYATIRRRLTSLGLDPEHLPGRSWAGGRSLPRRPLEELLREGVHVSGADLLARLFDVGTFERRCYDCGAHTWQGHPIPLELEHVNGDHTDNRVENLKPLCPNCHALTPTYRGRNVRLRRLRAATLE